MTVVPWAAHGGDRAAALGVEGDRVAGVGRPLGVEGGRAGQGVGRGRARCRRSAGEPAVEGVAGKVGAAGKVIALPSEAAHEATALPPSELKVTVSVALAVHWA